MNLLDFLVRCYDAWCLKDLILRTITEKRKISAPELCNALHMDPLTVELALAILLNSDNVRIVDCSKKSDEKKPTLIYSSREYLLNKQENIRAEKKRVFERVRQALTDEEFTIPALARRIGEDDYAVLEAIADLCNLGEVSDTGRSVQSRYSLNTFYPLYAKTKPVKIAID